LKTVSIIIACRNEEHFIGNCLQSIIDNDYDKDLIEIIVVDGMSTDKTVDIVKSFQEKYNNIRFEMNPDKTKYKALNKVIPTTKSDAVMIIDAHRSFPINYISQCINYLFKTVVSNVGGDTKREPREKGIAPKAFSLTKKYSLIPR